MLHLTVQNLNHSYNINLSLIQMTSHPLEVHPLALDLVGCFPFLQQEVNIYILYKENSCRMYTTATAAEPPVKLTKVYGFCRENTSLL